MRYVILTLALLAAIAAPSSFHFRPRPQTPYRPPLRPEVPAYLRPVPRAERELQVRRCSPSGMGLSWPRTDFLWDGPDLLFTTPDGRYRATFSDYPYNPQTVTPEPTTD